MFFSMRDYRVTSQQQHERRKKDVEEAGETTAAKETEEISKGRRIPKTH